MSNIDVLLILFNVTHDSFSNNVIKLNNSISGMYVKDLMICFVRDLWRLVNISNKQCFKHTICFVYDRKITWTEYKYFCTYIDKPGLCKEKCFKNKNSFD